MFAEYINLLGFKARDKVTGLEGVIGSVCFNIKGRVYYSIISEVDSDNPVKVSSWIDSDQISVDIRLGRTTEMLTFEFDKKPDDKVLPG